MGHENVVMETGKK